MRLTKYHKEELITVLTNKKFPRDEQTGSYASLTPLVKKRLHEKAEKLIKDRIAFAKEIRDYVTPPHIQEKYKAFPDGTFPMVEKFNIDVEDYNGFTVYLNPVENYNFGEIANILGIKDKYRSKTRVPIAYINHANSYACERIKKSNPLYKKQKLIEKQKQEIIKIYETMTADISNKKYEYKKELEEFFEEHNTSTKVVKLIPELEETVYKITGEKEKSTQLVPAEILTILKQINEKDNTNAS